MLIITEIVKHISKFLGVEFLITKETLKQNFNSIPYWNVTNFKMSKKSIFQVALKNNFNNENECKSMSIDHFVFSEIKLINTIKR